MNLLVIADPHIPIPPRQYGGTERVVHLLCKGLQERGHIVRLLAGPGSRDYGGGSLLHYPPSARIVSRGFRKLLFQFVSLWAMRRMQVVINFGRLDYLIALYQRRSLPLIAWFQNPVTQAEVDSVLSHRRNRIRFIGVSKSQFEDIDTAGNVRIVPNAVDTSFFGFSPHSDEPAYFVFLGRLTRNKGVRVAIEAAQRAGVALKIAGNISHERGGEEYFEHEVKPHLGSQCQWLGPVDDQQKRTLLQGAKGLLFPVQWNEPFGIVLIESLACGTPVIGWHLGATSEIIIPGKTGFLCKSVDEMAYSIQRVLTGAVDRRACREDAEDRFSQERLIDRSLSVICELLTE